MVGVGEKGTGHSDVTAFDNNKASLMLLRLPFTIFRIAQSKPSSKCKFYFISFPSRTVYVHIRVSALYCRMSGRVDHSLSLCSCSDLSVYVQCPQMTVGIRMATKER